MFEQNRSFFFEDVEAFDRRLFIVVFTLNERRRAALVASHVVLGRIQFAVVNRAALRTRKTSHQTSDKLVVSELEIDRKRLSEISIFGNLCKIFGLRSGTRIPVEQIAALDI